MKNIFSFKSYKLYLQYYFSSIAKRGARKNLAEYLNCQPGYISQVINGNQTNFSNEHLELIGSFIELSENEKKYFILLGLYEKAGSVSLKKHFEEQITALQKINNQIKSKVENRGKKLSENDQAIYYSHWAYLAIHMLISISDYKTKKSIYKYFNNLEVNFIDNILDFLLKTELIQIEQNKFAIGKTRIHLSHESPLINLLHQNFRYKAIENLSKKNDFNLHYSSALVLSYEDSKKIKEILLNFIKEKEKILLPSPEERLIALNIDLFEI